VKPKLPEDFEALTWSKLQAAVQAVHTKQPVATSLEELYRVREGRLNAALGQQLNCHSRRGVLCVCVCVCVCVDTGSTWVHACCVCGHMRWVLQHTLHLHYIVQLCVAGKMMVLVVVDWTWQVCRVAGGGAALSVLSWIVVCVRACLTRGCT
jgi:hypothetical protein